MRICVTKKDIAKALLELDMRGLGDRSRCCPVAQSLKRGGFSNCSVGVESIWWDAADHEHSPMPPRARSWIHSFDLGYPVSPITFTIEKAAV